MWLQLPSSENGEPEDSPDAKDDRLRSRVKLCCCVSLCLLCLLPLLLILWLASALLVGTQGHIQFKHPFTSMAPIRSIDVTEVSGHGPLLLGGASLPSSLRGLFWLTKQGTSSALASFGGPNGDDVTDGGHRCSTGQAATTICSRVSGDRVWSFASSKLSYVYGLHDIRYIFTFNDVENPTYATIDPYADWSGHLPGYNLFFLMKFDMTLLDADQHEYNGSFVWLRNSVTPFGNSTYHLVQVMDEAGMRIEPAWTRFVEYEMKQGSGVIYYRSYNSTETLLSSEPEIRSV